MSTVDPIVAILRERREGLGLSRREVGRWAGIDEGTVRACEVGARAPSLPVLRLWAAVLGYDVALTNMHRVPVPGRASRGAVQDLQRVAT